MMPLAFYLALSCSDLDAASVALAKRQVELIDRLEAKTEPAWVLDALEIELLVSIEQLDVIDEAADTKRCTYLHPTRHPTVRTPKQLTR